MLQFYQMSLISQCKLQNPISQSARDIFSVYDSVLYYRIGDLATAFITRKDKETFRAAFYGKFFDGSDTRHETWGLFQQFITIIAMDESPKISIEEDELAWKRVEFDAYFDGLSLQDKHVIFNKILGL